MFFCVILAAKRKDWFEYSLLLRKMFSNDVWHENTLMKIKKYNTVLGASARIFFHTYKFIVKTVSVTTHIDICIFCCSFGASWIYPMINWNKPGPTIGVVIGSAVGLIVLHVILVGITVTRKKLTQRFERKHTHGNTHTRTHPHAHTDTNS